MKHERDQNPFQEFRIDHSSHHKKIRLWFTNPSTYKAELELKQKKFPNHCIYHLTRTHATMDCHVKKDCDKVIAAKCSNQNNSTSSAVSGTSTGQLRHLTEEVFEDAVDLDVVDESLDQPSNDTNEVDLLYFARVFNHHL